MRLRQCLNTYSPDRILILGDLFHSEHNNEWEEFNEIMSGFPGIELDLVIGNHDILKPELYKEAGIKVYDQLIEKPFVFTHMPLASHSSALYNLCGHVHPAVKLKGKGRQSLKLACFYFGENFGILPAFGTFTGSKILSSKESDLIYVIAGSQIMKVE